MRNDVASCIKVVLGLDPLLGRPFSGNGKQQFWDLLWPIHLGSEDTEPENAGK